MPHWLIHGAFIAGRALAGLIGCLCFYVALFMYEDEAGNWQNRLDNLWVSIYDRVKITSSLTIALFNTISQKLMHLFSWIFGSRLLSARSVSASINLSIACGILTPIVLWIAVSSLTGKPISEFYPGYLQIPEYAFFALFCILMATLPSLIKTRAALMFSYSSLFVIPCWVFYAAPFFSGNGIGRVSAYLDLISVFLLSLAVSLASDLVVLVAIRKTFSVVSSTISKLRIIKTVAMFALLAVTVEAIPALLFWVGFRAEAALGLHNGHQQDTDLTFIVVFLGAFSFLGNAITLIYCLIPVTTLFVVLCHSAFWPLTSRVVYPLCRYRIFGNRKVLFALGSFCFIFALNIEHQSVTDILKLFS
jgi:hypothetical protein